jgi:hypothetical protein
MGTPAVGRYCPHLVAKLVAFGRITRFEIALVGDRVLLHVFERDVAPLPVIAIEFMRGGFSALNPCQPISQVERVVNTAVHAHAPQRIVDMGGIASQKRAASAEGLGHALVHPIERGVDDLIVAHPGHDRREQRLRECVPQRDLVRHVGGDRKH